MVSPVDRDCRGFRRRRHLHHVSPSRPPDHVDRAAVGSRPRAARPDWYSTWPRRSATWITYRQGRHDPADVGQPRFRRQSFIPSALDKLKQAREIIKASGRISVWRSIGGVKADNIAEVALPPAQTPSSPGRASSARRRTRTRTVTTTSLRRCGRAGQRSAGRHAAARAWRPRRRPALFLSRPAQRRP